MAWQLLEHLVASHASHATANATANATGNSHQE